MLLGRTTLSKFLIEQLRGIDGHSELAALLVDVAAAVKQIAAISAKGSLGGATGVADGRNASGDEQKKLDVLANDAVIAACDWSGLLAGMASEELEAPYLIPAEYQRGGLLLVFDPLDGSSNTDINMPVGTIFSVLRHERGGDVPVEQDFLQPGHKQLAAGYAIYGPSTMLVLTVGRGSHGFTLDRETGNFILTNPNLTIPVETQEFAINTSNERFWEPPVQRYVAECKNGKDGDRKQDFNMRWIACLVAEVHRILVRGGVFLYPRDSRDPSKPGRLRLMYEANPMAMLIEQAGGRASTGRAPVMNELPAGLHQQVPLILGSKSEVERLERYHYEFDHGLDAEFQSPLFNERSLYRADSRFGALS